MHGLNKAYLIGHIGHDPELRTTANGRAIVKLSLATPHRRKVGEEWMDTPDWHRLTLFDAAASFIDAYAKKGDMLAVECSIRPNKWTDGYGADRYEVDLVVDRVLWLNGKHRGAEAKDAPLPTPPEDDGTR